MFKNLKKKQTSKLGEKGQGYDCTRTTAVPLSRQKATIYSIRRKDARFTRLQTTTRKRISNCSGGVSRTVAKYKNKEFYYL